MILSEKLIVGEKIKNYEEIRTILQNGVGIWNIYLIITDKTNNCLMEIISSTQIFKRCYAAKKYKVIAIANGEKEAIRIVQSILIQNIKTIFDHRLFKSQW